MRTNTHFQSFSYLVSYNDSVNTILLRIQWSEDNLSEDYDFFWLLEISATQL